MKEKQKMVVALAIALIVLFAVLYWSVSSMDTNSNAVSPMKVQRGVSTQKELPKKAVPTNPDTVVDKIIENDADADVLSEEESGEAGAISESIQDIDDATDAYNE